MSLMRLLTAGKSWVGQKDPGTRYRMTDPRAMPKFGSGNPFAGKAAGLAKAGTPCAEPAEAGTACAEVAGAGFGEQQREVCGLVNSDSLRKDSTLRLTEPREQKAAEAEASEIASEDGAAPGASRVMTESENSSTGANGNPEVAAQRVRVKAGSGWLRKVTGVFGGRRKRDSASMAVPPVQCELSLDKVKVVRNDLSDTDVEIVRRKVESAGVKAESVTGASSAKPNDTGTTNNAEAVGVSVEAGGAPVPR